MKAYVLVHIQPGSIPDVVLNMRRVEEVTEAHMTFGPYDAVVTVQADDVAHLGEIIASKLQPIPGVLDTMTCLVADRD